MSILIFLAVLFVLVLVHELGHFAVAKWTGMRVDEFGIGFPPKLFGIRKGETEYTFNLFPVGGFVKIYAEDGAPDGVLTEGAFVSKSKWAQAAVLVAGVTMNVLLAWVLAALVFAIGVRTSVSEAEATESAQLFVTQVLVDGPAYEAGLPAGAVVEAVQAGGDTLESLTPSAFSSFVQDHADEVHTIMYTLNDEVHTVSVTPETRVIEDRPDQAVVGIALSQIDIVKRSFSESLVEATRYVARGLKDIFLGLVGLVGGAITGEADLSQVAGPIGIVGLVGEASAYGITTLLMFTAFISLNLAVINILPFPALDGGRLVMVAIEAVKGSPIDPRSAALVNTIGFFILIFLMVAVTWNDILRLI